MVTSYMFENFHFITYDAYEKIKNIATYAQQSVDSCDYVADKYSNYLPIVIYRGLLLLTLILW